MRLCRPWKAMKKSSTSALRNHVTCAGRMSSERDKVHYKQGQSRYDLRTGRSITPAGISIANGLAFAMHMCPHYPYPRVLKAIDVGVSGLQMYNPEDGKVFSFQFDEFDQRYRGTYDVDFRKQEPK